MTGIENALQNLANIVTVVTGAIYYHLPILERQVSNGEWDFYPAPYIPSYHNEKENAK